MVSKITKSLFASTKQEIETRKKLIGRIKGIRRQIIEERKMEEDVTDSIPKIKKVKAFSPKKFAVKRIIRPAPSLTTTQKRKIIQELAIEPAIETEGISLEEPIRKASLIEIKSNILKSEDGSILTRSKNIFFRE